MINMAGQLYLTANRNDAINTASFSKILVIGEFSNDPQFNMMVNASSASIFLPPYEAACAECDGNLPAFENLYSAYLNSHDVVEMILVIIRALIMGKNITLYLSPDEASTAYSKVLLNHLFINYGIQTAIPENGVFFSFNPAFSNKILDLLYLYEYINFAELFTLYDGNHINPMLINKLVIELNPYTMDRSAQWYQNYFDNYMQQYKSNNGKLNVACTFGG